MLKHRKQEAENDWIFSSHAADMPMMEPKRAWKTVKEGAHLSDDIVIHSLRHTFSTYADDAELRESIVQNLMGHSRRGITQQVYTHRRERQLRAAMEKVTSHMMSFYHGE